MGVASRYVELSLRAHELGTLKPIVNVFHYRNMSTFMASNTQASLITNWLTVNQTLFLAMLSIGYVMDEINCRNIDDPLDAGETVPNPQAGTTAGDWLPLFNAATFQMRTGVRGRSYKGSKHLGPISEDDTVKDDLSGAALAKAATLEAALLSGLTGSGSDVYALSIYSPTVTFGPGGGGYSDMEVTPVTEVECNIGLGTMRRRKVA